MACVLVYIIIIIFPDGEFLGENLPTSDLYLNPAYLSLSPKHIRFWLHRRVHITLLIDISLPYDADQIHEILTLSWSLLTMGGTR